MSNTRLMTVSVADGGLAALYSLVVHALWCGSSGSGSAVTARTPLHSINVSYIQDSKAMQLLSDYYPSISVAAVVSALFVASTLLVIAGTGVSEFFRSYTYVTNDDDDGQDITVDEPRDPALLPWNEQTVPAVGLLILPFIIAPLMVMTSEELGGTSIWAMGDFMVMWWSITMACTHIARALRAVEAVLPYSMRSTKANSNWALPEVNVLDGLQEVVQLVCVTVVTIALIYFYHTAPCADLLQHSTARIAFPRLLGSYSIAVLPLTMRIAIFAHIIVVFMGFSKVFFRFSTLLRPVMATFFLMAHFFGTYGLYMGVMYTPTDPHYPAGRGRLTIDVLVLYVAGALGITAGVHRMWAHRAYKANFAYRCIMLVFNSIAQQGTIYDWTRDHRLHHAFSEEDADPHNASKGFFHAHMGWLLCKRAPAVVRERKNMDVSDLLEDPLVVIQMKLEPFWNLFWCFLMPSLYAVKIYGDFSLGFFTLGLFRWIITLHCTWCVNSVAHLWGTRPYRENIGPVESPITALLACGEGWHNWHHTYAFDYAASELGAFRQFNPTKLFIDSFARIGWVWDRKRATALWQNTVRKRAERARATLEAYASVKTPLAAVATTSSSDAIISGSSATAGGDGCAVGSAVEDAHLDLDSMTAAAKRFASPLTKLIPAACHKISTLHSLMYLFQDVLVVSVVAVISALCWWAVSHKRAALPLDAALSARCGWGLLELFVLTLYSLAQGTAMMALWVTSYECAGGRFSRYKAVNAAMAFVLSTLLLIPYNSRSQPDSRSTARKGGRVASHLSRALYEDFFAFFDMDRWWIGATPFCGFFTVLSSVTILAMFIRISGFTNVMSWYLGAWLVMNSWLFLYQRLLLVKVNTRAAQAISGRAPSMQRRVTGGAGDNTAYTDKDSSESTEAELLCFDPDTLAFIEDTTDVPLPKSTVEFFTRQWLISAMEVFDRTTLTGGNSSMSQSTRTAGTDSALSTGVVDVRLAVRVLVFLFGSMHRHLTQINVLQAVDLSVPHYHVQDAMQEVEKYVGELRKVVMSAATKVDVPTGIHGVVDRYAN